MSELSRHDVLHVANLARLELSEEELTAAQRDLGKVIRYIDGLSQLKTDQVRATNGLQPRSNVLRADNVMATLSLEDALANAPVSANGHFRIPKILES
jgi:aspartyl-tRNA(Asn)/glutamyl-tRNA(Gln) amidotransferase subunit C